MHVLAWIAACVTAWAPGARAQESQTTRAPLETPRLTRPPELLHRVPAEYPSEARAQGLSGDVGMNVTIGADGRVIDVEVTKPAGHGFDEAAVAAMKQSVFSPAEIGGKPAAVVIAYTEHFRWAPASAPPPEPKRLPVTLEGRLLERGTRVPVAGASVDVSGVGENGFHQSAESDADGRFELRVPPGTITISVFDAGHRELKATETIHEGKRLVVTWYLHPKSVGLFETVVQAHREQQEVTLYDLHRQELQSVPGTFGDPLRVLQDLPGVARAPLFLGQLYVRGSGPNDTPVYLDGVQLPLVFHFLAGPSVVNAEFVDKLEFWPGGFGARYGRGIGGTVDVETRKASEQQWHGSFELTLLDAEGYLNAPIADGLTLSAAGRRSYYDLFLPAVLRAAHSGTIVTPAYDDYQVLADYRPASSRHSFQLFLFGSDDALTIQQAQSDTQTGHTLDDHTGFLRLEGAWQYRGEAVSSRLQLFGGSNRLAIGLDTAVFNQSDTVFGGRETFEWLAARGLTLRAGLDVLMTVSRLSQQGLPILDYRPYPGQSATSPSTLDAASLNDGDFAAWLELQLDLPHGLRLFPGVRLDQFLVAGRLVPAVDPRLTVRDEFDWFGKSAVKGSVGLYHESPTQLQLSPFSGNTDLSLQKAVQTSVGVEHSFGDLFDAEVTGFYNHFYDLAEATTAIAVGANGSVNPYFYRSTGVGNAWGLEVFLRRALTKHLFGWISYTLSWSQLHDPEILGPNGAGYHPSPFDERHVLTAVGSYRVGDGWQFGARFQVATGLPSTPYVGSTFEGDSQSYAGIQGPAFSARLPLYQELDIRIDKEWTFNKWILGAFLDVRNVYNAQNQELILYDYRYRTTTTLGGIPFLPNLGVRGRF